MRRSRAILAFALCFLVSSVAIAQRRGFEPPPPAKGVQVGEYASEFRRTYTTEDGLPVNDVLCVAVNAAGEVFAGTAQGVAKQARRRHVAARHRLFRAAAGDRESGDGDPGSDAVRSLQDRRGRSVAGRAAAEFGVAAGQRRDPRQHR
jgi:hypothetical protein